MLADVHIFVQISAYGKQSPAVVHRTTPRSAPRAHVTDAVELAWQGHCAEHLHLEEAVVLDHSIAFFRTRPGLHAQRGALDSRSVPVSLEDAFVAP